MVDHKLWFTSIKLWDIRFSFNHVYFFCVFIDWKQSQVVSIYQIFLFLSQNWSQALVLSVWRLWLGVDL